jgi:hypothetical protein
MTAKKIVARMIRSTKSPPKINVKIRASDMIHRRDFVGSTC